MIQCEYVGRYKDSLVSRQERAYGKSVSWICRKYAVKSAWQWDSLDCPTESRGSSVEKFFRELYMRYILIEILCQRQIVFPLRKIKFAR